jgi:alpha-mannosidase
MIFERIFNMAEKKVYAVATSHLDTVWSWDLEESIREYLKATLD